MSTTEFDLANTPAWGKPLIRGRFRVEPEDFQVDESLGFEPEGQGEHWLVQIRKRGDNTAWVAGQLAHCAGVGVKDVGYCGLKDRHAVTTQWFSIYQPRGEEPRWADLEAQGIMPLRWARHERKLRRGQHQSNHFVIRLRDITPLESGALERLDERLQQIASNGVPNYFGPQRFGRDGGNLVRARDWLVGGRSIRQRQQRSMALSAARSWLFNRVLEARVREGGWRIAMPGEPLAEATGPLWGRGRPLVEGDALALENEALAPWSDWLPRLEHVGLSQERRALCLRPEGLTWRREADDLVLAFGLPPGTFATAVLAEVAELDTVSTEAMTATTVL
ncbi:tRNA pseudouridine(13) synthase TruD [Marinimicrobium agarilyticum]|uniref:tRNA pseudouridine(13) synthase TruD n=1 Tax=Marinimicrobium agarilyticum TaxID=306546 RepID=UPI00040705D5|nr:tRNA pseudouridine(13) synthase TruD [Marinimicrobium agarilyticum]